MDDALKQKHRKEADTPTVRVVVVAGDGRRVALGLLAKKVLEEKERKEKCRASTTSASTSE
jgi:hypothetical protein